MRVKIFKGVLGLVHALEPGKDWVGDDSGNKEVAGKQNGFKLSRLKANDITALGPH